MTQERERYLLPLKVSAGAGYLRVRCGEGLKTLLGIYSEEKGWKVSDVVRIAIVEKLEREGYITLIDPNTQL